MPCKAREHTRGAVSLGGRLLVLQTRVREAAGRPLLPSGLGRRKHVRWRVLFSVLETTRPRPPTREKWIGQVQPLLSQRGGSRTAGYLLARIRFPTAAEAGLQGRQTGNARAVQTGSGDRVRTDRCSPSWRRRVCARACRQAAVAFLGGGCSGLRTDRPDRRRGRVSPSAATTRTQAWDRAQPRTWGSMNPVRREPCCRLGYVRVLTRGGPCPQRMTPREREVAARGPGGAAQGTRSPVLSPGALPQAHEPPSHPLTLPPGPGERVGCSFPASVGSLLLGLRACFHVSPAHGDQERGLNSVPPLQ